MEHGSFLGIFAWAISYQMISHALEQSRIELTRYENFYYRCVTGNFNYAYGD